MAKSTGMAFGSPKRDTAALSSWVASAPSDNELPPPPAPAEENEPLLAAKSAKVRSAPVKVDKPVAVTAEPAPTARMVIDIDKELHKRLRRRCLDEGETMADVVRRLVADYIGR